MAKRGAKNAVAQNRRHRPAVRIYAHFVLLHTRAQKARPIPPLLPPPRTFHLPRSVDYSETAFCGVNFAEFVILNLGGFLVKFNPKTRLGTQWIAST